MFVNRRRTHQTVSISKRMIRLDLLQPGDVILTLSLSPKSAGIVAATNQFRLSRLYSHAILVISRFHWLETDSTGAGITQVRLHKIEQLGSRLCWLSERCSYRKCDAFRHRDLALLSEEDQTEVASMLLFAAYQFCGMTYPSIERLGAASNWLSFAPNFKQQLLALAARQASAHVENEGPFCSELVALMYTRFFGLDPFICGAKTPAEASPNDFSDKRLSQFRKIKGFHVVSDLKQTDIQIKALDKYRSLEWVQEGIKAKLLMKQVRANQQVTDQTDHWSDEASLKIRQIIEKQIRPK